MSKIKNVIVVYDFAIINGGAAKVAIQSAIALKKRGLNVVYFSATSPIDKEMVSAGIEVISLDSTDINTEKNRLKAIKMGIYNSKSKKIFKKFLEYFYRQSLNTSQTLLNTGKISLKKNFKKIKKNT